jgi:hypothetical protein
LIIPQKRDVLARDVPTAVLQDVHLDGLPILPMPARLNKLKKTRRKEN